MKRSLIEELQKSRDARREALERTIAQFKKPRKKKGKGKSNQEPKGKGSSSAVNEEKEDPGSASISISFQCSALFSDERDESLEYQEAESTYKLLAEELTEIACQETVATTLLWPAFPSCVPAIHTVATCAAYERGDKIGIRAVYFPAKANAFGELNHIRIDAQWLYDIAQQWQSRARDGAACTINSECEHKDILYLTLRHYLDKSGDPAGYPSIGETFPTFPVGRQVWGDFCGKIFNGVFKNVPKRGNPLEDLGNPSTAPDAIFGIHPDLSFDEIVQRLTTKELLSESGRSPDVAILNLNSKQRSNLGSNWANKAARFVKICQEELPYSPVGVQILIDDPIAYLMLRKTFSTRPGRKKRKIKNARQASFRPLMCLNGSISPLQGLSQRTISDTRLVSHVVDAEAAAIAAEFSQAARKVQGDSQTLSSSLRQCAGYLLWSARLPSGQDALQKMLHNNSESDQELQWKTETYSWIGVVRRLDEIRAHIGESAAGPNIDRLIEKANKMLDSYSSGTPCGIKLTELLGKIIAATAQSSTKKKNRSRPIVTVAVPSALQARLVYDTLERDWPLYDDNGNEIIQVVRTVELFSRNAPVIARRLLVIGAQAQTVAELCSSNNLPKRIELILSAGDAERIAQRLDFILGESEFERLHTPVSELVKQLKEFLESASTQFSLLSKLVYWRPQTHAQVLMPSLTISTSIPDFHIQLDDGRSLGVYKSRPVLIYDETRRPPFVQRTGSDIEVGDHLLVISDEMRDDIEVYMELAGKFKSENVLRKYHEHVCEKLRILYPNQNLAQMIKNVQSEIQTEFPDSDDITSHKVRYWVTVDQELDQPFDELLSHAPRSKEDFDRFVHILNIDEPLAQIYWTLGINSLRIDRRHEGRQASLVYQRFLMDPSSVASLLSIPAAESSRLQVQARSNVYEIIDKKRWS